MPYTISASTQDCYEGTTVLINRFDIRSQRELDAVETAMVYVKSVQWEDDPQCASFDFEHYKAIHAYLFGEIYDWAGKIRTINISKKGTQFCKADDIPRIGEAIFKRLAEKKYFVGMPCEKFVDELSDLYERTNELHPFREGNGRTQRLFLAQLAQNAGYRIDFSRVPTDDLMIATIQAANGTNDYLKELISKIVVVDECI